jgi:predicted amidohydrolase
MQPDLHLTLVQTSLFWESREQNLEMFSRKLNSFNEPTDLILLPEMFSTGFSMNTEKFAETMDGVVVQWMKEIALKKNAVICGSLMMKDGDRFFNRLLWMAPDGRLDYYDKRHLFGLGEEHRHYTAGKKKLFVELKGWKILPLVCYDLRFPVWSRNAERYDLLLYVANWPERRVHAWKTLLEARAIENQCYTIGVNRVGHDGHGVFHSGESSVIDPRGEMLWREKDKECIHTCTLSFHHLNHIRESLPFLKDGDAFEIKLPQPFSSSSTMEAANDLLLREKKWLALRAKLKDQFGKAPDLNAVLLLIGIRELGFIQSKFSKEEKQDLLHIATCAVLSRSGYYALEGADQDGWPHWVAVKKIPVMSLNEQEDLLKDHILRYFDEMGY